MSKTTKVQLVIAMTWAGVNYAPGMNDMPEDAAKYALKKKFGTSGESVAPLSLEETMERMKKADFSDEVLESLKHYQPVIAEAQETGRNPEDILQEKEAAAGGKSGGGKSGDGSDSGKSDAGKSDNAKSGSGKGSSREGDSGGGSNGLPTDFPMEHVFSKPNKLSETGFKTVAEIQAFTRDELISIEGIGEASADKALAYGK